MLYWVNKDDFDLIATNIAVTDYSGRSTPAKGLVSLTVKISSNVRNTMFVVVFQSSYNALLGRDWICNTPTFGRKECPGKITVHQIIIRCSVACRSARGRSVPQRHASGGTTGRVVARRCRIGARAFPLRSIRRIRIVSLGGSVKYSFSNIGLIGVSF
ncbi:hypothetical protein PIB30_001016 [Stylosanthes scabra]|uniref:Uncharacterized protein n=1 Tax=Stylosanthes scabra TaxID=79078 RepID=A0ABU6T2B8_9FABA|nr:hypothetical protein [Stylosanthes scabra]